MRRYAQLFLIAAFAAAALLALRPPAARPAVAATHAPATCTVPGHADAGMKACQVRR